MAETTRERPVPEAPQPVVYWDRPIQSGKPAKLSRARNHFEDCVREMETALDDFDPAVRRGALEKLHSLNVPAADPGENVNLHTHTFFSYNASGWSPSRFAWEAHRAGLQAAGIIDFDVLDGMEEFLSACELLGLRGTGGIEVRAFLKEFSDAVIDSPGEPGVHYIAGSGVVKAPAAGTPEAEFLAFLRGTASDRNRQLIARINAKLPDIALDYDKDVLPVTCSGNATERHIISAYVDKSLRAFPDQAAWRAYWAGLGLPEPLLADWEKKRPDLEEKVRAKLAKRGGFGYVQPDSKTFPPVEQVYAWVKACGGVPMDSWLDGTSEGEARGRELLECNRAHGALALNLIPDRNWNIKDPEEKRLKLANLQKVIALAAERRMPLHIGTEGNKAGLPFVDDLAGAELNPYKPLFISGARILVGHHVLARFADFPYAGPAAEGEFGADIVAKNAFFESVGALPPVDGKLAWYFRQVGPEKSLETLRRSARKGWWSPAPINT